MNRRFPKIARVLVSAGILFACSIYTPSQAQTVGNCEPAQAEQYLNVNNVRARILNNGNLFYRSEPHVYQVPRFSNSNAIFAASIWVGGLIDEHLHVAATRYGPYEFWAGPLEDNGMPPDDCDTFDRIYKVSRQEIETYERSGVAAADLASWPTGLGAPTIDSNGIRIDLMHLPFFERKHRVIDLEAGERPDILGDQGLWWVMNDRGNTHDSSHSPNLGIEVHGFAYAMSSSVDALNDATLYRYRIFNRNDRAIERAYFGVFFDPDLGDAGDDFVGTDTLRSIAFVYNADNFDISGEGYGEAPPAVGFKILKGPIADDDGVDNNRDGFVDEPGERMRMSHTQYYNGGGGVNEDPQTGLDYYRYMRSIWKNGQPVTFGGNGFDQNTTTQPTNYFYPGDPVTSAYWSEMRPCPGCTPNPSADRRFIVSNGPFDLAPGQSKELDFAVVYGRGKDHLDSITEMRRASDELQAFFDSGFKDYPPGQAPMNTPILVSPDNGVTKQPIDPLLVWEHLVEADAYQIVLWSEFGHEFYNVWSNTLQLDSLHSNTQYFWRVREENSHGLGPWSDIFHFVTSSQSFQATFGFRDFQVVQNAGGPIDPPESALAEWQGFPGTGRPTDRQQVGEGAWIIATGMSEGCPGNCGEYTSFIARSIRRGWAAIARSDFEIRFTAMGSLHYDRFGYTDHPSGVVLGAVVPFELWNIGIGTPDDPSDDFRMIPAIIDWENDGFSLRETDHESSGGDNDPETDWFYWHNPSDTSPGTTGYDAWATAALAGVAEGDELGEEVMARFVFFNWNGGDVSDYMDDPVANPFDQDMPEEGTIFRILTQNELFAPVLSAPRDQDNLASGDVSFYWQTYDLDVARLLVATDPQFLSPIADSANVSPGHTENIGIEGTYYWKIVSSSGMESDVWEFTVAYDVGVEEPDEATLPGGFEFSSIYPNPAKQMVSLRLGVPTAQKISIEIFDVLGRRIREAYSGILAAGRHNQELSLNGLAAGTYYIRVESEQSSKTKMVVLVK